MLITIITPTIGTQYLKKLLISINEQEGLNESFKIEHFIVVDNAPVFQSKTNTILNEVSEKDGIQRYVFNIPFCSGANGFKGHKIYSSIPQFSNGDYIIFLDDDNFLKSNHILNFVNLVKNKSYDWLYSLRSIVNKDDKIICDDNCESLGYLNHVFYNQNSYLIDTNTYFVKSDILKKICSIWNKKAEYNDNDPDRVFGKILMSNFLNYECTKEHTLCYRTIESEEDKNKTTGVSKKLFIEGNKVIKEKYNTSEIWKLPTLFLAHFDEAHTEMIINRIYNKNNYVEGNDSIAFKQWQLNLFDDLGTKLCIKNAYASPFIPNGSIVWYHMCNFETLPQKLFTRKDLFKVLYTIESPNIRHQTQWNKDFLAKHFDIILTYWTDLFKVRDYNTIYFPFIHRLDFNNENDMKLICNDKKDASACIVLENRNLEGKYKINDIQLEAQDSKRAVVVEEISKYLKVHCYGESWKNFIIEKNKNGNNNLIFESTVSRFLDSDKTIDYYNKHMFTIILENCDATGYVSEKIYDAWMVSSIPIYYGNFNIQLEKYFGEDIPINKMMININKIGIENIGTYISELYVDEIEELLENINKYKKTVLEKVSINSYNKEVLKIVDFVNKSK